MNLARVWLSVGEMYQQHAMSRINVNTCIPSSSSQLTILDKCNPRRQRVITLTQVSTCKCGIVLLNIGHCTESVVLESKGCEIFRKLDFASVDARINMRGMLSLEGGPRPSRKLLVPSNTRASYE